MLSKKTQNRLTFPVLSMKNLLKAGLYCQLQPVWRGVESPVSYFVGATIDLSHYYAALRENIKSVPKF